MTDYRKLSVDLLRFAALSREPGRPFSDPVYKAITEGRQDRAAAAQRAWDATPPHLRKGPRPFYSSCGDLAHWLLFRLGVRYSWINRDEFDENGNKKPDDWHFLGADNNVTTLACRPIGSNPFAVKPPDVVYFEAGDILIVNVASPNTTHVSCVVEHHPETGYLLTADYGQPHGALRDNNPVEKRDGRWWRGKRTIDSWLSLTAVLHSAKRDSKLVEPESAEDYAQRFQHVTLPPDDDDTPTKPETPHSLTPVAARRILMRGMSGADVAEWQGQLRKDGWIVQADGVFGTLTDAATRKWQAARKLEPDGVVGPKTRAAIGTPARSPSGMIPAVKP